MRRAAAADATRGGPQEEMFPDLADAAKEAAKPKAKVPVPRGGGGMNMSRFGNAGGCARLLPPRRAAPLAAAARRGAARPRPAPPRPARPPARPPAINKK